MAAAKSSTSSTVLHASTPGPQDQLLPNIKDPCGAYRDQRVLQEVHFDVFSACILGLGSSKAIGERFDVRLCTIHCVKGLV